jgi:hypothetical protein
MKRRTVSLTDDALEALDRIAKEHRSTVSGVVEAAGRLLRDGGPGADDLKRRLVPDRRGGDRRPKQQGNYFVDVGEQHLSGLVDAVPLEDASTDATS